MTPLNELCERVVILSKEVGRFIADEAKKFDSGQIEHKGLMT